MIFRRPTDYAALSDEMLMERLGDGDIPAFDALYQRYGRRLHYYFHRMLSGDRLRAEDLTHDLFVKIIERPDHFRVGMRFSTWIFSVAHNICKNEYRSRAIRQSVSLEFDELPDEKASPLEAFDSEEFGRLLLEELERFDEELRTTFLLRYHEGFSLKEISQTLGCPEGTVKSRLYNMSRRLAARLRQYDHNS